VPRKRDTSDGDEYADVDEAALADAVADALGYGEEEEEEEPGAEEEGEPAETGTIRVRAQIEWAGTIDQNGQDGVRSTHLDSVPLAGIREAAADLAKAKAGRGPLRSYRAKGWRAQLRQMLSTKRGQAAAREAGLNRDTIRRWQSGTQAPSAASRARISGAYGQLRDPKPAAVAAASHRLSIAVTAAVRTQYGVNVRLRNIEYLRIEE
jgi:transcriptional regulator with XRE-family HTH domain